MSSEQPRGPVNNVKMYRDRFSLTQDELGEKIGVNGQTISWIELRRTIPRAKTKRKLAEFFNVSVLELFPPQEEDNRSRTTFNPAA
jgi:putative transcriptional regulator